MAVHQQRLAHLRACSGKSPRTAAAMMHQNSLLPPGSRKKFERGGSMRRSARGAPSGSAAGPKKSGSHPTQLAAANNNNVQNGQLPPLVRVTDSSGDTPRSLSGSSARRRPSTRSRKTSENEGSNANTKSNGVETTNVNVEIVSETEKLLPKDSLSAKRSVSRQSSRKSTSSTVVAETKISDSSSTGDTAAKS